ncbi:hypothetical protein GOP47_0008357 [Adiantum capillus-veneris]|uniref:Protein kinase domain-containing protein n=1 Tax=Adiantum capillus-veneris TaxID=13818 RepID=A0A9D4UYW9_ADICA|nr:hypothetical protein GOP47_0008357 [Adiantum capillus-veneris]
MSCSKVDAPNGVCPPGKHHYLVWRSLFEIDTRYAPIKAIGKGAYGVVCSARDLQVEMACGLQNDANTKGAANAKKVAIKKIGNAFENCTDARRTLREIRLLRQLRHENVITVRDIMCPTSRTSFNDVYIVYDLMDTDLHHIIRSSQPLTDDHCQYFIYQLLRGLKYVHSANVLHRDLKPSNLLLNANCDLKICDFGLARVVGGGNGHAHTATEQLMTEYVVTRWYRAPELLLSCEEYTSAIDVWSVGCIFAELLGRKPIFPGKDYLHQLKLILNTIGSPNPDTGLCFIHSHKARAFIRSQPRSPQVCLSQLYPEANPLALNLIERMLVFDPAQRITVAEALQHPYLSLLHDHALEPTAPHPLNYLDLCDENEDELKEDGLREKVWKEMLYYHPEVDSLVSKSSPSQQEGSSSSLFQYGVEASPSAPSPPTSSSPISSSQTSPSDKVEKGEGDLNK